MAIGIARADDNPQNASMSVENAVENLSFALQDDEVNEYDSPTYSQVSSPVFFVVFQDLIQRDEAIENQEPAAHGVMTEIIADICDPVEEHPKETSLMAMIRE
ncbi:hypothetical protein GGI07_002221, partial [Coemansia sp. Benny D115]